MGTGDIPAWRLPQAPAHTAWRHCPSVVTVWCCPPASACGFSFTLCFSFQGASPTEGPAGHHCRDVSGGCGMAVSGTRAVALLSGHMVFCGHTSCDRSGLSWVRVGMGSSAFISPTVCFCTACELGMGFTLLSGWRKSRAQCFMT